MAKNGGCLYQAYISLYHRMGERLYQAYICLYEKMAETYIKPI